MLSQDSFPILTISLIISGGREDRKMRGSISIETGIHGELKITNIDRIQAKILTIVSKKSIHWAVFRLVAKYIKIN